MSEFIIENIDIPTLAFSRGLMQLMLGGLLLYLGTRDQQARGASLWAIGFFFNGISLFAFPIQAFEAWEIPSTVVNHLALGASSAFFLVGFWKFGLQPERRWITIVLIAIPAFSLLAWEWLWPNGRLRILTTASGQALFLLALQHSLRLAPRVELAVIYRRLRYVVLAYLVLMVWAYGNAANLLPTSARVDLGYHRLVFSGGSLIFMLTLAVGCLALQFAELAARSADLAKFDWLTGLLNRRGFFNAIRNDHGNAALHDSGSVIALDIDYFKQINDRYGHAAGDHVLQVLGAHLRELTTQSQRAARMGGEEFCIVMPGEPGAAAQALAERIRARCGEDTIVSEDGQPIRFTVSAGVVEFAANEALEKALARADEALYTAKRAGRDQVVVG